MEDMKAEELIEVEEGFLPKVFYGLRYSIY